MAPGRNPREEQQNGNICSNNAAKYFYKGLQLLCREALSSGAFEYSVLHAQEIFGLYGPMKAM